MCTDDVKFISKKEYYKFDSVKRKFQTRNQGFKMNVTSLIQHEETFADDTKRRKTEIKLFIFCFSNTRKWL